MTLGWYGVTLSQIVGILVSTLLIYIVLVVLLRLNGLRSFSKMSGYDFAITVAMGSVLASTIMAETPSVLQGAVALLALFIWQRIFAGFRTQNSGDLLDNRPLLLMRGDTILHENLKRARVTEDDLYAKLREANVLNFGQIRAVVLEGTGDVAVLHGNSSDFNDVLLKGVWDGEGSNDQGI